MLSGHRTTPAFDASRDLTAEADGRVERAAVEPGEEGLGNIRGGTDTWRRRGHFEPARTVAADRIDHARERGARERAGVDLRIQGQHGPRHHRHHRREPSRLDQRGCPAHRVRRVRLVGVSTPPLALAQQRHHRAACGELDRPDRDATQPTDTGSDVVAGFPRAGRDEPSEHLAHGDPERFGVARYTRHRNRRVRYPSRCRRARRGEHRGDVVGGGEWSRRTGGPGDDAARLPRDLQLHLARSKDLVVVEVVVLLARRTLGSDREAFPRRGQPPVLRLEVGDDLRPLLTLQRAGARKVLFRVAQETRQRAAPRQLVGFEHGELFGRGFTVGLGAHVHVELPRRERRGRGCRRGRWIHRFASTSPVGIMYLRCCGHAGRGRVPRRRTGSCVALATSPGSGGAWRPESPTSPRPGEAAVHKERR